MTINTETIINCLIERKFSLNIRFIHRFSLCVTALRKGTVIAKRLYCRSCSDIFSLFLSEKSEHKFVKYIEHNFCRLESKILCPTFLCLHYSSIAVCLQSSVPLSRVRAVL